MNIDDLKAALADGSLTMTEVRALAETSELEERAARAASIPKVETRTLPATHVEVRAGDTDPNEVIVEGYAALFASGFGTEPSFDMGFAKETIRRGAFRKTLTENPDVRFLVDHSGLPLARTKSGTLELREDETGLWFSAKLDATDPDVRSLVPKMRRGDMDGASFAFRTVRDKFSDDYKHRELVELSLEGGDVSVVGLPAYKATKVGLRSEDEALIEALQEMRAGKALSAKNESLVKAAFEALSKLVKGVGLDTGDDEETKPKDDNADEAKPELAEAGKSARSVAHYRRELELLARKGKR